MIKKIIAVASVVSAILCASIGFTACDKGNQGNEGSQDNGNSPHTHQYTEEVIAATCAQRGYTLHTCECGDKYEDNYTVSNAHVYENNVCKYCGNISSAMPDTQGMQFYEYYNTGNYYLSNIPRTVKDEYIKIPSTYNGKPVTRIGENVFNGKSQVKGIYISDSVTALDYRSIYDCPSLTSVTIGSGLDYISDACFYGCDELINLEVSSGNAKYTSESNCLLDKEKNEIIRGTVNSIIPDGVKGIGMGAFSGLTKLKRVDISDSVEYISYLSFAHCINLTSVNYGKSVSYFNNLSFLDCDKLAEITVSENNKDFYAVNNCVIQKSDKTLLFGIKTSVIPDDGSVEIIGGTAFESCGIESITIPRSVKEIAAGLFSGAFSGCEKLKDINYKGTKAEWKGIIKSNGWDYGAGEYTVHCTDGDLDKND